MAKLIMGVGVPDADALAREGEEIGGFSDRGWRHDGVVLLAHNHGLHAYRQEFRSKHPDVEKQFVEEGIEKIKNEIEKGNPVVVSVEKENGSYHTVLLIGIDEKGFHYHDPEREEGNSFLSFEDFKVVWRGLAIFFGK